MASRLPRFLLYGIMMLDCKEVMLRLYPMLTSSDPDFVYMPDEEECYPCCVFNKDHWEMRYYGVGFDKKLGRGIKVKVYEFSDFGVRVKLEEDLYSAEGLFATLVSTSHNCWIGMKKYMEYVMFTGRDDLDLLESRRQKLTKEKIIDQMTTVYTNHWDTANGRLEMLTVGEEDESYC